MTEALEHSTKEDGSIEDEDSIMDSLAVLYLGQQCAILHQSRT